MVNLVQIIIGCCLEGSYGPLVSNLNVNINKYISLKVWVEVIRNLYQQKWDTVLKFYGRYNMVHQSLCEFYQMEPELI